MNFKLLTRKDIVLYLLATGIFLILLFVAVPRSGFCAGFVYKFLYLLLRGPLNVEVPESIDTAWPISIGVEIRLLLTNPGFYSGLFIGCMTIDKPWHLWKGIIPSVLIISPLIFLCFIPNPGMLIFRPILLLLLALSFPQSLIGAILGWLVNVPMRKYTTHFNAFLDHA